jgi:hypothetical protein
MLSPVVKIGALELRVKKGYSGKKSICLVHERLYLYKKEYFLSCVKA